MFNGPLAVSGIYTVDAGGSEYNVECEENTGSRQKLAA
jgi:hypothetical protein